MATARAKTNRSRAPDPKRSVAAARDRGINTSNAVTAALVNPDKPLTDQQRLFVKFWAQGESILSASTKAGYADGGTFAYRMVRMPNILRAYNAEKEAYERDSGMTRKKVIDGLLEGIEMAKTMGEPSSVIGGWREIGRMCGYYEPVQVNHKVSVEGKVLIDRLEKLSDQELLELIEKRANEMQALPAPEESHDGSEAP